MQKDPFEGVDRPSCQVAVVDVSHLSESRGLAPEPYAFMSASLRMCVSLCVSVPFCVCVSVCVCVKRDMCLSLK